MGSNSLPCLTSASKNSRLKKPFPMITYQSELGLGHSRSVLQIQTNSLAMAVVQAAENHGNK